MPVMLSSLAFVKAARGVSCVFDWGTTLIEENVNRARTTNNPLIVALPQAVIFTVVYS
jgi:predicted ABC-type sugar transport system permease subunit